MSEKITDGIITVNNSITRSAYGEKISVDYCFSYEGSPDNMKLISISVMSKYDVVSCKYAKKLVDFITTDYNSIHFMKHDIETGKKHKDVIYPDFCHEETQTPEKPDKTALPEDKKYMENEKIAGTRITMAEVKAIKEYMKDHPNNIPDMSKNSLRNNKKLANYVNSVLGQTNFTVSEIGKIRPLLAE